MGTDSVMSGEIVVIPSPHPGHLFPAIELCNRLAARSCKITLFFPSSSSPSSLSFHPLITILEYSIPDSINFQPTSLEEAFLKLMDQCFNGRASESLPICAIVDEMISWVIDPLLEFKIPVVSFFTSSASSCSMESAMEKISPEELTPGRVLTIPGLPVDMALTSASLAGRRGPPRGPGGPHPMRRPRGGGGVGGRPMRGLRASEHASALIFNTCDDLERLFLDYVAKEAKKPVWGVGPLLPAQFWATAGSPFRDGEFRSKRDSEVSESEVIQWLDSKPRGSVIYVSFGSLVNPSNVELVELEAGLEESNQPFIWVIQPGRKFMDEGDNYFPEGLASRVGERGLVIKGWAPQLLILSHPSTGGYVCHCGWNSTVEALSCGVPVLTWPIRGDQIHNAKLMTSMLKVGYPIKQGDDGEGVKKGDVVKGIAKLMADKEIKKRADSVRSIFADGFPSSSSSSLDSLIGFVTRNYQQN